jgi:hypothetical protein
MKERRPFGRSLVRAAGLRGVGPDENQDSRVLCVVHSMRAQITPVPLSSPPFSLNDRPAERQIRLDVEVQFHPP